MAGKFSAYHFAQEIQRQRVLHDLTQQELAEKLHCTVRCVQKWESGESLPRIDALYKLAQVFSVSMDTFLGMG